MREGGQIPWDYDTDVLVSIQDYDPLVRALQRDLPPDYRVTCTKTDPRCRTYIMRITPAGYKDQTVHLDVFFLVGLPDRTLRRQLYRVGIAALSVIRVGKLRPIDLRGRKPWKALLILEAGLAARAVPLRLIDGCFRRLTEKVPLTDSKWCCTATRYALLNEYPMEWFTHTREIRLADGTYRIPVRYEEILREIYGDYRQVPPLEERIAGVMRHVRKFQKEGTSGAAEAK